MFGTTQLRTTFHLPAIAPSRRAEARSHHAPPEAQVTADVLQRAEHTLAAQAVAHTAARREELAAIDLTSPLSMSFAPALGVLRVEFASTRPNAPKAVIEALTSHLAPLLALEGVTRIEARVVDPRSGALVDARTIEAPTLA